MSSDTLGCFSALEVEKRYQFASYGGRPMLRASLWEIESCDSEFEEVRGNISQQNKTNALHGSSQSSSSLRCSSKHSPLQKTVSLRCVHNTSVQFQSCVCETFLWRFRAILLKKSWPTKIHNRLPAHWYSTKCHCHYHVGLIHFENRVVPVKKSNHFSSMRSNYPDCAVGQSGTQKIFQAL